MPRTKGQLYIILLLLNLIFLFFSEESKAVEELKSSTTTISYTEEMLGKEDLHEDLLQPEILQSTNDENLESSLTTEPSSAHHKESIERPTVFAGDAESTVEELGTAENPFLVTTFSELKQALTASLDYGSTKYIQLQNDIVYDGTTSIGQNTVIDGNGFAFLYSGTSYGVAHFCTGANNISITYKNISFGNDAYPNSTYYGILYNGNSNVHFTVENINYNIQNGGQPFWGNNDAGNSLEIRGQNSFYSSGSSYGGEFVEGYRTILFSEDSNTEIYNDTPTAMAIFWSAAQTVTIAPRAIVSIETSKPLFFYGDNATLNIEEQAELHYRKFRGTNYSSNDVSLSYIGTLTGNLAENSIAHFTTDANSFSGNSPIFNLSSPDHLVFDTNSPSKQVFASGFNPKFTRKDTDASTYRMDYLTSEQQATYIADVQSNTAYTITAAAIENGYSMAYSRMPKIENLSSVPEVAADISNIHGQIDSLTTLSFVGKQVQYKLAAKQLYAGSDLSDPAAQDSIEQAGDGVLQSKEVTLEQNSPSTGTVTKATFQQLTAATYYLYAKVEGSRIPGYLFQSLWQEVAVEVPKFTLLQFSNQTMAFDSPIPGEFGKQQNLDEYTVRNAGNVPTVLKLKSITRDPENTSIISLVDQFLSNEQELQLSLVAEKVDSKERVTMGPLIEKENMDQPSIQLNPFWESDDQAVLYFTGNYSGPMNGPQAISYRFSFAITAQNTNQEE